ncbi:hypothetical protein Tco_1343772 [Tanacetum coccineum]
MHNNIMTVGSRDRLPMLAMGRYAQWQSRFLRYIDTRPNGVVLRKCILEAVPERTTVETILTMSPENKAHYESEKEEIHLLLTGIRNEIYSTVDACKTAHEIWIVIESLQQESMESYYSRFYKMMNEMIRNNLTVATMQVNVQFLQQLQPEWSRFVTIVKQQHDLDTVSYHKLFDVLKQYQKEVNEIRAERIAKNANPLALVAAAQQYPNPYYQAPKSHKPYAPTSKQSSSTRSNATTKFKGKEIAKPITPPSKSAFKEDSHPKQAQRDKDMQKKLHSLQRQHTEHPESTINHVYEKMIVTEFERYKALNDHTIDYDKLECKLNETLGLLAQKDIDIKEGLKLKAYEILVVKEKHDELVKQSLLTKSHFEGLVKEKAKYVESLENEIGKLEYDKAEFSNMYDILLQECVSNDVMCSYLYSLSDLDAHSKLQCLYLHKAKECEYLA